jgi:hypothetical protein
MKHLSPLGAESVPSPAAGAGALIDVVTAVPGVGGLDPGIATALRTLDARLRRSAPSAARYGLVIDPGTGDVTVEISVGGPLPVRSVVEEVQRAVHRAVGDAATGRPEVLVRVQSLGPA